MAFTAKKPILRLSTGSTAFSTPAYPLRRNAPSRRMCVISARKNIQQPAQTDGERQDKPNTAIISNLLSFGTGTQRLKGKASAGERSETGTAKLGRRSGRSGDLKGTKRLRRGQAPGGSTIQRLGSLTKKVGGKDPNTVFVAGSTGRLGVRILRELLQAGLKVRAGARDTARAREFADTATSLGILPPEAAKRLQIVSVDLEDPSSILAAIGNSGKVVQAIGAAESNVLDIGAPKRVDGDAAINLVNAAVEAGAEQYVMVTSLGAGKFGWPASALNLFGGILVQKRRAEKALEQSGLSYVIVRPGGMERPTDNYKRTHNVRLATRDKLFGGQVSRQQVAELIAAAIANPGLAENKVLEVVAENTAPKLDYEVLLEQHPTEISQEERERQRLAQEELEDAAEAKAEAEQLVRQLQQQLSVKQAKIREVEKEVAPILKDAQQIESELAQLRDDADQNQRRQEAAKAVLEAAKSAQKTGNTASLDELRRRTVTYPDQEVPEASTRNISRETRRWSFNGKQQEKLAEDISRKEIDIKLGKSGSKPSDADKRLAEGIAKKEIGIKTGAAAPVSSIAKPQEAEAPAKKKKPAQSLEEVEKMREARANAARSLAKKEADFIARLEAQKKEEVAKQIAVANSRAEEARKKALAERDSRLARQEEALAEALAAEKQKKASREQSNGARSSASGNGTQAARSKAKENAKEARQWIDTWRAQQKTTSGGPSAGNSTQNKSSDDKPQNVLDAREWIRAWRARSLESKLPENSTARK